MKQIDIQDLARRIVESLAFVGSGTARDMQKIIEEILTVSIMQPYDAVEFYKDATGLHRWRFKASNGEIVGASCDGFDTKAGAEENFTRDRSKDKIELYQDKAGEWRWRATATDGNRVAAATEGYSNPLKVIENAIRNGYTAEQLTLV